MLREALVFSLLFAVLRRQGLQRLSQLKFHFWPLVVFAALLQLLLPFIGMNLGRTAALVSLIFSYLLLLFALYKNKGNSYLSIAAFGVALNFLVILANGGMPISANLVRELFGQKSVGLLNGVGDFLHVPLTPGTRLTLLSDVIPLRRPYPLPNIISPGDVFLSLGVFLFLEEGSRYRGRRLRGSLRARRSEAQGYPGRGPVS